MIFKRECIFIIFIYILYYQNIFYYIVILKLLKFSFYVELNTMLATSSMVVSLSLSMSAS